MKEVVKMAIIVPIGIDLWASLRSPDLFDPAIIPGIKKARLAYQYIIINI